MKVNFLLKPIIVKLTFLNSCSIFKLEKVVSTKKKKKDCLPS